MVSTPKRVKESRRSQSHNIIRTSSVSGQLLPYAFWSGRSQGPPKDETFATAIACVSELKHKMLLLKILYMVVSGFGEMKLGLGLKCRLPVD